MVLRKASWRNRIGHFIKEAREFLLLLNGKISNHSATIVNLLSENINLHYVQQISGHKKLVAVVAAQKHPLLNIFPSFSVTPLNIQQELMTYWNLIAPIFQRASIQNCTFNIKVNMSASSPNFQTAENYL